MTVTPDAVAGWRRWIGREERRRERLDAEALRRFAAAIGEPLAVEQHFPSLGHWAWFLPVAAQAEIGPDGHPARGGFLPPVTLPRRMFAAADFAFHRPLAIDRPAERVSTVLDVAHKGGRTGDLVLVQVAHVIAQDDTPCLTERQTIIYRDAGAPLAPVVPAPGGGDPAGTLHWDPSPVDLFRFSAVTFNGHRIHYDLPYAREAEGYPGLVVHGPLIATRLFALAVGSRQPTRFAFRAVAPLFAGQPIRLVLSPGGGAAAIRADGETAMTATIAFGDT